MTFEKNCNLREKVFGETQIWVFIDLNLHSYGWEFLLHLNMLL